MDASLQSIIEYYCQSAPTKVSKDYWCFYRDEYKQRTERYFRQMLKKHDFNYAALLLSALSELGGNSFDHNLGKSKELPGLCFYANEAEIFLFDDGQGIRSSLSAVGFSKSTDQEYVDMAMTEVVSGRAPEQRGNGLKLVVNVMKNLNLGFCLKSGEGLYTCNLDMNNEVIKKLNQFKNDSVGVYINLGIANGN